MDNTRTSPLVWIGLGIIAFLVWSNFNKNNSNPDPDNNDDKVIIDEYGFYQKVPVILKGEPENAQLFAGLCSSFQEVLEYDQTLPQDQRKFQYFSDVEQYLTFTWKGNVSHYGLPPSLGDMLAVAFDDIGNKPDTPIDATMSRKLSSILEAASEACRLVE